MLPADLPTDCTESVFSWWWPLLAGWLGSGGDRKALLGWRGVLLSMQRPWCGRSRL